MKSKFSNRSMESVTGVVKFSLYYCSAVQIKEVDCVFVV